ncbi:EsV-1-166 [Ectocarpus siliculosus]|uniref:EsV-1-166 n=1 Tax=Ectocarpus siliculosus TaxID=2880 RepID=D8LD65_ECTSI|nr:EsV-1-166 [Ectocarpus siliculosus]|eukprot:CBN75518.1 EsV-1-166 [Ectocarpus siliculosus]
MSTAAAAATLLAASGFFAQLPVSDGHVYMMNPVSRQLWGTEAFQEPGSPDINYCPHCFQSRGPAAIRARGGDQPWPHFNGERAENGNYIESDEVAQRHGVCGDPEQTAAEGSNRYGQENSNYPVLETYAEGGILEVKIVVATYHWGHVEMFLCDADDLPDGPDSVVTQSCFNEYPLDRAEDDEFNSPIDPLNRGRFILDPPCRASETDQELLPGAFAGDVATARFQLPQGVTCERCVVQMVYYTGNSCKHQGYAEFNPPSWPSSCAPSKADWINEIVGQHCGDGDAYPEEFWNCADVSITSDGGPGPAPAPTPETPKETKAPVDEPTEPSPAPAAVVEEYEPTYAPTPEEEYEEPTTAPFPVSTDPDCEDPVDAFAQCGGAGYDGSTCCTAGYECEEMADCYSECRPRGDGCSESWGQCGGLHWEGPECCWPGAECVELSDQFHQCSPEGAVN